MASPVRRQGRTWTRPTGLAVAALVVAGLVTGLGWLLVAAAMAALLVWPAARQADLRARREAACPASRVRWDRFTAAGSPLALRRRLRPAGPVAVVRGDARLLFVDIDRDVITLDGLLEQSRDRPRVPFWLRLRPPAPSWMRAAIVTLVRRWAADGEPVLVETKPTPGGYQATLSAGGTRMVLDVEEAGGFADAA